MLDDGKPQVPHCVVGATEAGTSAVLPLPMANRHGLILGATGTGKTVTLQTLTEGFSKAGVAVFVADVKGDLSGLAVSQDPRKTTALPVRFLDVHREHGHPLSISLWEMGPALLARLVDLTEAQEGALNIAFRLAREADHPISDLGTLRLWLAQIEARREDIAEEMGSVPVSSLNAIRRRLLVLEEEGGAGQFSQNSFDVMTLLSCEGTQGRVTVLSAERLVQTPKSYAFTLMYLLMSLTRHLDEIGDQTTPRLVFFFDEAHLLFQNASPVLIEKVEQIVRLIRSKGVGVYFATQNPGDIPDRILAQLSHKCIHALRCFTSSDRRAISAIAHGLIASQGLDIARDIPQLGVGEAIYSTLAPDGRPYPAEKIRVRMPDSRLGPLTAEERLVINGPIAQAPVPPPSPRPRSAPSKTSPPRHSQGFLAGAQFGRLLAGWFQSVKK